MCVVLLAHVTQNIEGSYPFEPTTQANSKSGNDIWLCRAVIVLDGESAGAGSVQLVSERNPRPILGGGCQTFS